MSILFLKDQIHDTIMFLMNVLEEEVQCVKSCKIQEGEWKKDLEGHGTGKCIGKFDTNFCPISFDSMFCLNRTKIDTINITTSSLECPFTKSIYDV